MLSHVLVSAILGGAPLPFCKMSGSAVRAAIPLRHLVAPRPSRLIFCEQTVARKYVKFHVRLIALRNLLMRLGSLVRP